ncbi:MAG: chemotaxis protein CheW [Myxococcota bacterium]
MTVDSETTAPTSELGSEGMRDWERVARAAASAYAAGEGAEENGLRRELLILGLAGSAYAIPVERIREIVRMRALTRVPRAPEWLLGVVTLRGEVVEVVDLRRRLGLETAPYGRKTRIIVLHGDAEHVTGVLVDSVSEVFRALESEIAPSAGLDSVSVVEICRREDEFVSILDIDHALGISNV